MIFPVLVQAANGQYSASLMGSPDVRVTASSRDEAIAAIECVIEKRVTQGELVALEIGCKSVSHLAGKYRTDPTLREICEEAYRLRDSGDIE